MALCCVIYTLLYLTYPRDRERARTEAVLESKMQFIKLDCQIQSAETKEVIFDEKTTTEMPFDDDNDERALLVSR